MFSYSVRGYLQLRISLSRPDGNPQILLRNPNCLGMKDSEFEDCLNVTLYREAIFEKYGVDLAAASFKSSAKWSERMKGTFMGQGKPWDDSTSKEVKGLVAELAADNPKAALSPHKKNSIEALAVAVENLIQS